MNKNIIPDAQTPASPPEHLEAVQQRVKDIVASMTPEQRKVLDISERQAAFNAGLYRSFATMEKQSAENLHRLLQEFLDAEIGGWK